MSILTWIEDKKRLKVLNAPKHSANSTDSSKGLWTRCDKCGVILYIKHLKENQRVCFSCSYHLQMMSGERIENLLDKGEPFTGGGTFGFTRGITSGLAKDITSDEEHANALPILKKSTLREAKANTNNLSTWRPLDETVSPCDPLKFQDQKAYTDRLQDAQERTGLQDAIQTGTGMIDGIPVALAVMDFSFMGGSMGSVVGEKITRLIEYATGEGLTLLIVSASGGARMQEGVFSLMQMAKISSALQIYQSCAKLLYISILTSPTTGGVTASFAMLGDIIFAEPKALIAFAGRRVIEQTLCEDLPDDFQTSEYMLHHGLVDLIVPRRFLRQALSETIRLYQNAPFKKKGQIPFGVQNPITFLTEEKIRRGWSGLTSYKSSTCKGAKVLSSKQYNTSHFRTNQNTGRVNEAIPSPPVSPKAMGFTRDDRYSDKSKPFKAKPKRTFREILTSFEIMLALFVSGNTKKQSKTSLRLQKSINLKLSGDFLSSKTKAQTFSPTFIEEKQLPFTFTKGITPLTSGFLQSEALHVSTKTFADLPFGDKQTKSFFWLYNNLILRASNRFYNKKFFSDQFISAQYKKNQPLFLILKNDFVSNTKQGFIRKEGMSLTKSLPTLFKYKSKICKKRTLQNPTNNYKKSKNLNEVYLQNTRFAWKNENGNLPMVESVRKKASASLKKKPLFLQKDGFLLSKSKKYWSFSKLLRVAFTKPCFFPFSRNNSKSLLSKKFLTSMKLVNNHKSLEKNRLGLQQLLFLQNGSKKRFAHSTFFLPIQDLYTKLDKSLIDGVSKKKDPSRTLAKTTPLLKNKQAKPSLRLKRSFVQQVLFDFGFYRSSVINSEKNAQDKSTFVRHTAKIKPLRDIHQSDGQTNRSSSMKRTANQSLYQDKKGEQNSALIHGDTTSSSLLYNFRHLAEATLKSNGLQRSNVEKSTGQGEPIIFSERHTEQKPRRLQIEDLYANTYGFADGITSGFAKGDAVQKRAFYEGQNKVDFIAGLNDTGFNRSAIGFKHTNYLFERTFSFLQNLNLVDNRLNKKQSLITRKSHNKVSGLFSLSSDFSKNPRDLSSVFLISGSYFDRTKQNQSSKEPSFCGSKASNFSKSKANQTTNLNKSPYTAKNVSVTDFTSAENDIDFLNQAIELAATESVEWRAFYIHQQLSENTGFVDEFLQKEGFENSSGSDPRISGNAIFSVSRKEIGNVLFYKSLCRSKNLFSG